MPPANRRASSARDRVMRRRGFTLVELMIVMTLIAIMALAAMPVFRGTFSTTRADHAARDLFAEMKAAQQGAVTGAVEYRVYFDKKHNSYWSARPGVTKDGRRGYLPVDVPGGESIRVPDRLKISDIKGRKAASGDAYYLAFYPSGACDAGKVTLLDELDRQRKYVIETDGT